LGQKKEAISHLTELQTRLVEAKSQLAASGNAQEWFDYCDRALAWLRKDGLPKLVHASVLKQLCSVVNEELSLFDDPFKVEVGEDLSFVAYFEDERVIPSKALSGGQKVMLALSFWSAVSRVFAKNLGLMILDEPTDGLDADNNERLYQIMLRWRQLLHQRGQQVIIITHDAGMSDVFDNIVQL
jgi:DNA repair exonuclease SbcCD ATPase subunit